MNPTNVATYCQECRTASRGLGYFARRFGFSQPHSRSWLPCSPCQVAIVRPRRRQPLKPQQVLFTTPIEDVISEYEEFTGRTAAVKTVQIHSRVSGYLDKVSFEDGSEVKTGDVLFQIDPRWFQAEANQAAANVSQYESRIERLNRQVARATPLIENRVKSQEEFDQYTFDHAEAKATLKGLIAAHRNWPTSTSATRRHFADRRSD